MIEDLDTEFLRIVNKFVPTMTIRRRLGDEPWFTEECRVAFESKQTAFYRWRRSRTRADWLLFRGAQRAANACYSTAKSIFSVRCRDKLASCASSHNWWGTLKQSVFGTDNAIPPLQSHGGTLISDPAGKAELLSSWFDSKQSRESVPLPSTCYRQPLFSGFAFRSREVLTLLLNLDSHGGADPSGIFPLFFKESAQVLAPKLSRVFRRLLREGKFPTSWRVADIAPIPKGPLSSLVSGYRPISITPILSKVFERLISSRLGSFMEVTGVFPSHQYSYRKRLGTCDALLDIVCAGQQSLDGGGETVLVQIDFSSAFDRVNHAALIHKLREVGVGGSVLGVISSFLVGRKQSVRIEGCRSSTVDVVSGVPQGSVLGPLLFLLYTSDLPGSLENTLVGYADDSTLISPIPRPADRLSVACSMNRDLDRIRSWCLRWGMVVNPSKTKGLLVSRSRTVNPVLPELVLDGSVVEMVGQLKILGVYLDRKLTFEHHIRSVASAASSRVGILRRTKSVFQDPALIVRCFWSFLLPILEYCSPVWRSAAATHLHLLDRVVNRASALSAGSVVCNLWHRRAVASLCMFYRIRDSIGHPVGLLVPPVQVPRRATRAAAGAHAWSLDVPRVRTVQFGRSFVPYCVNVWNGLDGHAFSGENLAFFKSSVHRQLIAEGD